MLPERTDAIDVLIIWKFIYYSEKSLIKQGKYSIIHTGQGFPGKSGKRKTVSKDRQSDGKWDAEGAAKSGADAVWFSMPKEQKRKKLILTKVLYLKNRKNCRVLNRYWKKRERRNSEAYFDIGLTKNRLTAEGQAVQSCWGLVFKAVKKLYFSTEVCQNRRKLRGNNDVDTQQIYLDRGALPR